VEIVKVAGVLLPLEVTLSQEVESLAAVNLSEPPVPVFVTRT
jgi:hypothetical protein